MEKINRQLMKYLAEGDTYEIAGTKIGLGGAKRTLQHKVHNILEEAIKLADENKLREQDKELLSLARKRVDSRLTFKDYNQNLATVFEKKARNALKALTPRKLRGANAQQLMIVAATAIDKARLLGNESTANIAIKGEINLSGLSNKQLIEQMKEMREKYAQKED